MTHFDITEWADFVLGTLPADKRADLSSPHALGRRLRTIMDRAREQVAAALLGRDKELFFCSGASEGNRWLVDAVAHSGEIRGRPFRVLVSPFEHPSLMKCLVAMAGCGKINLEIMRVEEGQLKIEPSGLKNAEVINDPALETAITKALAESDVVAATAGDVLGEIILDDINGSRLAIDIHF